MSSWEDLLPPVDLPHTISSWEDLPTHTTSSGEDLLPPVDLPPHTTRSWEDLLPPVDLLPHTTSSWEDLDVPPQASRTSFPQRRTDGHASDFLSRLSNSLGSNLCSLTARPLSLFLMDVVWRAAYSGTSTGRCFDGYVFAVFFAYLYSASF